jgi:very-short-patch-repair endonuclease
MRKEILRRAIVLDRTEEEIWDELARYRRANDIREDSFVPEKVGPIIKRVLDNWGKELEVVEDTQFESPIEEILWMALKRERIEFEYQKEIGPYRVDFFFPSGRTKLVVELLGKEYHSDWKQQKRDMARRRYLAGKGYMVLEYSGFDINQDVFKCVNEIKSFL